MNSRPAPGKGAGRRLVEAPGVEGVSDHEIPRNMAQYDEHSADHVFAVFRRQPQLLVHAVTHVADSLGAGERADVKAVCVLLETVFAGIEAEREGEKEVG